MLSEWLDHPDAVQGGVAPLVVALIIGTALWRSRFAWCAIAAGCLTTFVLSGDFAFEPLTASRKVILVGLVSALVGVVVDAIRPHPRGLADALAVVAGMLAPWVFLSVLRQRDGMQLFGAAIGIALFIGVLTRVVLTWRNDGIRTGAVGVGLGLATGVAGVLSASIGYLLSGVAVAAGSGAMLLIQLIARRSTPAGYTGALPIGVLTAYFAAATFMLAELPWYALPLLVAVPLAASLPLPETWWLFGRAAAASSYALVAALIPILAAWFAARGSLS